MQNIGSKSSLSKHTEATITCTNAQCQINNEEAVDLRQQVSNLQETVSSLENTIQLKDVQLQNMRRDNERLSVELKKQQRCVRNIKQQLDDERFFYQREKDYFNDELQKMKSVGGATRLYRQRTDLEDARKALEEENKSLRKELAEKAKTTYNLCIKFLRMKYAKDSLRQKLDQLLKEHLQVMADMMEKLDEGRGELNIIVSDKFQEPLPLSKAKFLQVVQRNARLVHENAMLRVQIEHLTLNIEKLKSGMQKPKLINVDAKIIAKLAEQSSAKCDKETARWPSSQVSNRQDPVDSCGDGKLISKIRSSHMGKHKVAGLPKIQTNEIRNFRTERIRSVPDIVRMKAEGKCSSSPHSDCSTHLRDASTNT
ncbi:uncharacterized protein LOC143362687 isoform X1 [Halictus rubicundus]|uniref:uncharacterized protein LOC143362687 isoform X1 n=1 Tax=Halictus rubicundus TaxID=77578 RepID=UPI004036FD3F